MGGSSGLVLWIWTRLPLVRLERALPPKWWHSLGKYAALHTPKTAGIIGASNSRKEELTLFLVFIWLHRHHKQPGHL
jgi:hypothetical protein